MADNVTIKDASGVTVTIATHDVDGVHFQKSEMSAVPADPFGADADVASASGSISAKLRYLAGTGIAGMTSLPEGSNTIGKLAANSGVDIGDTDVTSVVPGTGATNLGKAVDAVAGATDTGVSILTVRKDTPATLTPADGDYTRLFVSSTGRLWASATITAVTPGTSSDSLGKQEDSGHSSGDTGVLMLGVRNSTHAVRTSDDGDYTPIAVDAEGCVLVVGNVAHDAPDADPPIKIGGKAASTAPTNVAAGDRVNAYFDLAGRLAVFTDVAIPAGTNNIGDVDVLTVPADPFGANADAASATGSISAKLRFIAGTGIPITNGSGANAVNIQDGGNTITVDGAVTATLSAETTKVIGTVNVAASQTIAVTQNTASQLNCTEASASAIKTAVELIDDTVFADDAGFTVGTSKVHAVGGLAVSHGADPDAADANDVGIPLMNRHRIPFMLGGHPNAITYGYNVSTGASNAAIITVGAGSKIVVTQLQVTLGADVSTTPSVIIGFGTANTPAIGNAAVLLSHPALAGGGGVSRGDGTGILGIGADNEDLRVTAGTITGGSMHVVVTYFTIPT